MKSSKILIRERLLELLAPNQKPLLLAFSGGVDSVVLAHLLLELNISFQLAHVNYRLRSEESEINMRFCERFANENALKLHLKLVNQEEQSLLEATNLQATAREIRYNWFDQVMKDNELTGLLTAHHADDQIETVLLHQFRGAGLQGLSGMTYCKINHYRPLLDFYKADLEHLAIDHQWQWSVDSSNFKDDYSRNFIRNQIVPLIESRFPSFKNTMVQNIRIWQDETSVLSHFLQDFLSRNIFRTERSESISWQALNAIPSKRSVFHAWIGGIGFNETHFTQLEQVYQTYQGEKKFELVGAELRLLRDRIELVYSKKQHLPLIDQNLNISIGTECILSDDNGTFKVVVSTSLLPSNSSFSVNIPENLIGQYLQIRRWREGDKIKLSGLNGSKKLSDLFVSNKFDAKSKSNALVLVLGERIIAVWPLRVAEGFDQKEKGQLRIEIDLLKSI